MAGKSGASRAVRVFAAAASSPEALAHRADVALVAVERPRMPMVIADARQADNPIVRANQSFLDLPESRLRRVTMASRQLGSPA